MKINKRGIIEEKRKTKKITIKDYLFQGGTTAVILMLSDLLGQIILRNVRSYFVTPLFMGLYGFITGNLCFLMYTKLDSFEGPDLDRMKGFSWLKIKLAFYKMLFDQFVWSPFGTFMFIFVSSVVDSKNFSLSKVIGDYFRILFDSYKIWPVIQMINFLFVPLDLRVMFISVASLLWSTYVKIARQA
ncbi:protein Mpv17 [Nematocida minor]|uniref:protein Mpv17 n=1 Tax=Nematocida minor TaxID=1912983 RepID=UPI00222108D7|nr:protein Mpv17 [Nematocida minor]KAI5189232.1 protein Mpv17 [Nematocida minor]